ncbi:zinc-ribbon domain-containing protein [Alphaproteobacteria bacterium]|jgi:predicted Zn finger-like uncharacterized protein|nr:zinc-ribbon domain-containing protein [Alphaproteobacteria bacterium]
MLLICPQCETIFCVDRLRLYPAGKPVHCMICGHIWSARLVTSGNRQDMSNFASYLHKFRLPVIAVLICAGLMTSLIKGRGILTAYFPRLIAGFHRIGLPTLPPIDTLFVVILNGPYVGEVLRLRGALRNVGSWSGHAAPLRVRVTRPDGMILNETVIRPDDRIIAANQQSPFFVQLDIDLGAKAEVSAPQFHGLFLTRDQFFCRCGKIGN